MTWPRLRWASTWSGLCWARALRLTHRGPPHRRTVYDWPEQTLVDAEIADLPLHGLRYTAAAAWLSTGRSLEFVGPQASETAQHAIGSPAVILGAPWRAHACTLRRRSR